MGPVRELDGDALRANVAAFAALGAPVAAVVKSDGYGWGARRIAREVDRLVESYLVADADELAALRPATAKPIRLLADAPPGRLGAVLDLGGIPNVSTAEALAEAAAEAGRRGGLTIRVGVLDAAGWATIRPADAGAFAGACARHGLEVELWTHLTSPAREAAHLEGLAAARRAFTRAGVAIASLDAAATSAARRERAYDRLRIGAGLFGARMGAQVATRNAIRLRAPIVRRLAPGELPWAGYGDRALPVDRTAFVVRCGYGDGYPRSLAGIADIVSVGMQYTVRLTNDGRDPGVLIGAEDEIDGLAAHAGISAHELLTGLACR
ncbi:MAG TPA: alanine racemase [Candidatus Elarobacter sp.]|jgi:alanine racemase